MLKRLIFVLVLTLLPLCALAQQPVVTMPMAVTSTNASGTITVTNTFQQIWPATSGSTGGGAGVRRGCIVVNTGTHVQYVFFGSGTATTATSIPLNPASVAGQLGGYVTCGSVGGTVAQDQVQITGTAGDTFTAMQE